jgi:hypothetical protein
MVHYENNKYKHLYFINHIKAPMLPSALFLVPESHWAFKGIRPTNRLVSVCLGGLHFTCADAFNPVSCASKVASVLNASYVTGCSIDCTLV